MQSPRKTPAAQFFFSKVRVPNEDSDQTPISEAFETPPLGVRHYHM
jgi:hypothetical protein